jgi:hypothetical protein
MNGPLAEALDPELLLERATTSLANEFMQRQLPRALDMLSQVGAGEPLSDDDTAFFADTLASLACASELFEHHPDIEALHRCAQTLYDDIMTAAFANETR